MFWTLLAPVFLASVPTVYCLDLVKYGAFTQTATYSIANQLGIFQSIGLNVTYLQIPNSTFAYPNLLNGGYDVLTGTIDNVVNLRFNQNASLTVLGQLDAGPDIVIAAAPNITSVHQLRGKPIIVDSPTSGYAYILRKTLSLYGLRLENGDYFFQASTHSYQTAGSTALRYKYLTAGALPNSTAVHATILTYPFTQFIQALPLSERPTILARVSDVIQPLSSSAITVAESSLSNDLKRDVLIRFFAALYAANKYLARPENKNCATRAIQRQLNVTEEVAKGEYAAATDPISGESINSATNFNVSRQGLLNVIDVRAQFGGLSGIANGEGFDYVQAIEPGIGRMIDYSVRNEAIRTYDGFLEEVIGKGSTLCLGI
ncbi:hypothetical protein HYFRA_00005325 [Hymenoscyphus fraxineus]|uniref:SsuA/THI5-like domain-containing protein n=1 Tax=Hymenoscyphus fraxineus TaxID=746836 RepID=A0A9N9Q0A6_9HELO|nr:hypothetical protein HYFRA_00005325 [Hymenoscyphus fraxineus]